MTIIVKKQKQTQNQDQPSIRHSTLSSCKKGSYLQIISPSYNKSSITIPLHRSNDRVEDNAFSLYDLHNHALEKKPWPRGHEISFLVDPSLVIITTCVYLVCLIYAWE